jgi:prepilin-type processing-associated H-X9-DG protein
MHRQCIVRRAGFTAWDLLTVVIVLGVLAAMGCPAVVANREVARRIACTNQLKQISLALHDYATANRVFPPGTITATDDNPNAKDGYQYGVTAIWGQEAFPSAAGKHGTSWILRILHFIESAAIASPWDHTHNVGGTVAYQYPASTGSRYSNSPIKGSNFTGANAANAIAIASCDIKGLYCPNRRNGIRPGMDDVEPTTGTNLLPNVAVVWKGGGTDYGGCVGRHVAYSAAAGHIPQDADKLAFTPGCPPGSTTPTAGSSLVVANDGPAARWGIFGRVNVGTKFSDIKDGTAYTIMTGELQRIHTVGNGVTAQGLSHDGWAVGGDATGFSTGVMAPISGSGPTAWTGLMNNQLFQSPGSDHANGANFGMADGSVTFLSNTCDNNIFALMGSMADKTAVSPD